MTSRGRLVLDTVRRCRVWGGVVDQPVLIDVDRVEVERPSAGAAVGKVFRAYAPEQTLLLPPSLDDWLPAGHLARFVGEVVDEHLDLSAFYAAHTELRGAPPYEPRLLLKVLLYGYATGVTSSRRLEGRCSEDVAFRFLAGNTVPSYRAIIRFRTRHLESLTGLFEQVLGLCRAAGMVSLGQVALDGTKVRAAASRRKAMSYARMVRAEAQHRAQVRAWFDEVAAVDAAEDEEFGAARRGDELPPELARKETRAAALRKAKAALEEQARAQAAEAARRRVVDKAIKTVEAGGEVDAVVVEDAAECAARAAAAKATPKPKAQRNFTDPESRIMKTSDGSFHQCFNAQAVVDADRQVIVAAELTDQAADAPHFTDLLDATIANSGAAPRRVLADAGYWSEANAAAAAARGLDALIATGRCKHGEQPPPAPRGRIPSSATPKERMARKLRTKKGKAAYARRKAIVEPVFGQMRTRQDAGQVRLRGLDKAKAEWLIHCLCHNLLKLHTDKALERLADLAPMRTATA
jgi:transposase